MSVSRACTDEEHEDCPNPSCACTCHRFQQRVTVEQIRELRNKLKEGK